MVSISLKVFPIKSLLYAVLVLLISLSNAQEDKSFFKAPRIINDPSGNPAYAIGTRKFTGIPSLAITKEGKMYAIWYTGNTAGEDQNNYVVVSTSDDEGETWSEILAIDPDGDGPVRAYDPQAWIDPNGQLWLFWAQAIGHDGSIAGVWTLKTSEPDDSIPKWDKPERLTNGVMMNKPIVLSSGEWVLPASTWRDTDNSAKMIISRNEGKTWKEQGAVHVPAEHRNYDEHMIVEKNDGALWMLVRTKYGIGESFSRDRGKTWSDLVPSKIEHPAARFFIHRLNSGNLLLVKHGPISLKTKRSHLMAFISKDDGKSWSRGLLLDQRAGVSYPDGVQLTNGTIKIIYDFNRRFEQMIQVISFTENDILADDYDARIVKVHSGRKIVTRAK